MPWGRPWPLSCPQSRKKLVWHTKTDWLNGGVFKFKFWSISFIIITRLMPATKRKRMRRERVNVDKNKTKIISRSNKEKETGKAKKKSRVNKKHQDLRGQNKNRIEQALNSEMEPEEKENENSNSEEERDSSMEQIGSENIESEENENSNNEEGRDSWIEYVINCESESEENENEEGRDIQYLEKREKQLVDNFLTVYKKIQKESLIEKKKLLRMHLYAGVIQTIAFPQVSRLPKESLPEQILTDLKLLAKSKLLEPLKQIDESIGNALDAVIKRANDLFVEGIEFNWDVYRQRRLNEAKQKQTSSLIFNPNPIVTTQIFRQIIKDDEKKQYSISYGQQGIAKTFAYVLYHQLSDSFLQNIIGDSKETIEKKKKLLGLTDIEIWKLFYWTMDTGYTWSQKKVKALFKEQCKQLRMQSQEKNEKNTIKELENMNDLDLDEYVDKICKFYTGKGIQTLLLMDQINSIFSAFRKRQVEYKKAEQPQKQKIQKKYDNAFLLNELRLAINQKNSFIKMVYNSSINIEELFKDGKIHAKQKDQSEKNSISCQKLSSIVELQPQGYHQTSRLLERRVLYSELAKLDSVIWLLTDCVIFELRKRGREAKKIRKKVFETIKKISNEGLILTPLCIRLAVEEQMKAENSQNLSKINKLVKAVLRKAFSDKQSNLEQTNHKFINKLGKNKERIAAQAQIWFSLFEAKCQGQQLQKRKEDEQKGSMEAESNLFTIDNKLDSLLHFLKYPLYVDQSNQMYEYLADTLNKSMFVAFSDSTNLQIYLNEIETLVADNLADEYSWISKNNVQKIVNDKMRTIRLGYTQRLEKQKGPTKPKQKYLEPQINIGFAFFSNSLIDKIIKARINQILSYQTSVHDFYLKRFYTSPNGSCYGSLLEMTIFQALKKEEKTVHFDKKKNFIYNGRAILNQSVPIFSSLPKLSQKQKKNNQQLSLTKQNEKRKKETKVEKRNRKFLSQFLSSTDTKDQLFKPENQTSKCVDIAIKKTFQRAGELTHQICLFNVTCQEEQKKIMQKFNNFLQAYKHVRKDQVSSFIEKEKNKEPNAKVQVFYGLIGTDENIGKINKLVQAKNEQLEKKQLKLQDEQLKLKREELKLKEEQLKLQDEQLKLQGEELKLKDEQLKLQGEELKLKGEELKVINQKLEQFRYLKRFFGLSSSQIQFGQHNSASAAFASVVRIQSKERNPKA